MENFFNTNSNPQDNSLNSQYDDLKDNYYKIFIEAAESIRKELDKFKPENPCTICSVKNCKKFKPCRKEKSAWFFAFIQPSAAAFLKDRCLF